MHAKCQHHLTLPERQGIGKGGLNPFHQQTVVVLEQPDLRRHLKGNRFGQLKIINLLLKAIDLSGEISCCLSILGKPALLCLLHQCWKLHCLGMLQLLLTGQNVHGELFIILHIQLIHLIQHCNVFQKRNLMTFHHLTDLVHIYFCFIVFRLKVGDLCGAFLEEIAKEALVLLILKAAQLCYYIREHLAHFAHILGAHIPQRTL